MLQSAAWGRFRSASGWRVVRVTVPAGATSHAAAHGEPAPTAAAQVLVRRTPVGLFGYVPRGPVCTPEAEPLAAVTAAVRAAVPGVVAIRYEPSWLASETIESLLSSAGLRPVEATQPPSTLRIELDASEDELLAAMKPKWRYNTRLAERSGVRIEEGGEDHLALFGQLMTETAARDGFNARPMTYYAAAWRECRPWSHLYLAYAADTVLAAILVFHFGTTATYLYGASSDKERNRMPNHLLQWEAIRRAKADGRRWYDFWGIPDEIGQAWVRGEDPRAVPAGEGGLWGVWRFKSGFGGSVVRSVGAWDDVVAPARYLAARWAAAALAPLRGR
jgi:peptidoglycan pentaglycine glycine transferase (the first glycine)